MELIAQLINSLGVSEDQAKGGAGLLFKLCKEKLGGAEFSQIADNVPGVDDLISGAPDSSESGLLGAVSGMLGGSGSGLGSLASLAQGFDKLGLDAGMISQFLPIVVDFVKARAGDEAGDMLGQVLSGT